jgi:hypothetical protein
VAIAELRQDLLNGLSRLLRVRAIQNQQPAIVLPKPDQGGGDLFFLGAGQDRGQTGKAQMSQAREPRSQCLG